MSNLIRKEGVDQVELKDFICPNPDCKSHHPDEPGDFVIRDAHEGLTGDCYIDSRTECNEFKEHTGGTTWGDDNDMECLDCGHTGKVIDFARIIQPEIVQLPEPPYDPTPKEAIAQVLSIWMSADEIPREVEALKAYFQKGLFDNVPREIKVQHYLDCRSFQCPNPDCHSHGEGQLGDFRISEAEETYGATIYIDGNGDIQESKTWDGGASWDDDAPMQCLDCNHKATVKDFANETEEDDG